MYRVNEVHSKTGGLVCKVNEVTTLNLEDSIAINTRYSQAKQKHLAAMFSPLYSKIYSQHINFPTIYELWLFKCELALQHHWRTC